MYEDRVCVGSCFLYKPAEPAEGLGLWRSQVLQRNHESQTASSTLSSPQAECLSSSHLRHEPAGQGLTRVLRRRMRVMGTYHTRLSLSGSSSWRSVPSQHPYGSLLPEGAMPEAGCHRDCTCLRLAEVPTCCGSDRFPPCFQTGCSSCSAGLLRLGVPSRGYPSLQHSPAREGRGHSARTATPAADSKCGGLGSTKCEDPARDTASRL